VRNRLAALVVLTLCVRPVFAGWLVERTTRTEGAVGPSTTVWLLVSKNKVKELHEDETYFLWDLASHTLFQVNPKSRTYSGGAIEKMIADVKRYLDEMRDDIAHMSEAEREALARDTHGMPMPVPPAAKPALWTVKKSAKKEVIADRPAELYEVYRDGKIYEQRWIATGFTFGKELDYRQFARSSRRLEASFASGMGQEVPEGKEIENLDDKGLVVRSVLVGEQARVVSEVTRLESRDVPDSTFVLPVDYRQKGAQLSDRGGAYGRALATSGNDERRRYFPGK